MAQLRDLTLGPKHRKLFARRAVRACLAARPSLAQPHTQAGHARWCRHRRARVPDSGRRDRHTARRDGMRPLTDVERRLCLRNPIHLRGNPCTNQMPEIIQGVEFKDGIKQITNAD